MRKPPNPSELTLYAVPGTIASPTPLHPRLSILIATSPLPCPAFLLSRCDFRNTSAGEDGRTETLQLFRVTPRNVTGIRDRNTGTAAGDLTFRYSARLGGYVATGAWCA